MKTKLLPLAVLLATLAPVFAAEPDLAFAAHEWGTFTSVQGADGVQMDWNPLAVSELPKFVYERSRAGAKRGFVLAGKTAATVCRQRMETPVIYFYTDKARTVDVSVGFPQGQVTEWYPQESAADLNPLRTAARAAKVPALHWAKVDILPKTESAGLTLPQEKSGSHYYAARATDAALLRVTAEDKKAEVEKFLFYRGTGSFQAPLTVTLDSADATRVTLKNAGTAALRDLFVCTAHGGAVSWEKVDSLAPGAEVTVVADEGNAKKRSREMLAAALRESLVQRGLFAKEAAAMVQTWEDSWLGEPGLRVLYTLPRAWTDRTLPLAISPAPKTIERVMVGRAEIITPVMEQALLSATERYVAGNNETRPQTVKEARALGLGRFAEPTLRRVMMAQQRAPEFSAYSWELLQKISAPAPAAAAE